METGGTTIELMQAIAAAELANPAKGTKGQVRGRTDYMYAALDDILATVVPALRAHGVVLQQEASTVDGMTSISTRLTHAATGQWVQFGPLGIPHGGDAQAVGSAITYGRRYQVLAALGLAAEDDDGRSAGTWEKATAKPSATSREAREGVSTAAADTVPAEAVTPAGKGKAGGEPPTAGATFDELRKLTGSAAAAREQVNRSNDKAYNARSIVDATSAELRLAIAEWQEAHPALENA